MARVATWVSTCDLSVGDWIADPHTGQPARIKSIIFAGKELRLEYQAGSIGRLGYAGPADREMCKFVRASGQKARKK